MLLVAFSLLTSAATAYAECAWVLWVRVLVSNPAAPDRVNMNPWDPIHTLGSRQECSDQLRAMNYRFDTGAGYVYSKDGTLWQAPCLPDTVDPRGPKGK